MHVFFLEFVTQFGGAPRSTIEFAQRLSRHVPVTVIDPYGCCAEYAAAVRAADLDYRILNPDAKQVTIGKAGQPLQRAARLLAAGPDFWRLSRLAAETILREPGGVVLGNNAKSLLVAGVSPRLRHIPLLGYMRGWYTPDMLPPHARWIYARRCARLFAVSHATRAALACAGLDPAKIVVLHNPIDVEALRRRAAAPGTGQAPQTSRRPRILLPALLSRAKGQHVAVRAIHLLAQAGYDPELWLAGNVGPGEDATYVDELGRIARELGVGERIIWLGLHPNVPRLMAECDVVILPSHTEGLPRVVIEAMAMEKPVVATPVGGILDLILPGVTGHFSEVDDPASLARGIRTVLENKEAAAEMTAAAKRFVIANLTPETHTARALATLRSVATHDRD